MIPISVYIFLLIELIGVSYIDLKQRKISNYWPIINLLLFIIFLIIFPDQYIFQLSTFIYPVVFLFVGFILFVLKIMGAGDTKYLFSFFLLIPKEIQDHFFVSLLWMTIIIGLSSLLITIAHNLKGIFFAFQTYNLDGVKKIFGQKFPYAPVILLSWVWIGWYFRYKITGYN